MARLFPWGYGFGWFVATGGLLWGMPLVGVCGMLLAAVCLALYQTSKRAKPAQIVSHRPTSLLEQTRADYLADRINVISFLRRVEALFTARLGEVADWETLDWTTSPLEPCGSWSWKDDELVAVPPSLIDEVARAALVGLPLTADQARASHADRNGRPLYRLPSAGMSMADQQRILDAWAQPSKTTKRLPSFSCLYCGDPNAACMTPEVAQRCPKSTQPSSYFHKLAKATLTPNEQREILGFSTCQYCGSPNTALPGGDTCLDCLHAIQQQASTEAHPSRIIPPPFETELRP